MNGIVTPAGVKSLMKDTDGEVAYGDLSYSVVVGILLYLSGHSQPDIACDVNCAVCYSCIKKD